MRGLSRAVPLEEAAVVCALCFFGMAGSIPGIAPNQANEMTGAAGTPLQKAAGVGAQVLINGLLLLLLCRHRARVRDYAHCLLGAALLPGWVILSTIWSQAPLLTLRRAVPFALASLFGMLLPLRYSSAQLLRLLQISFLLLAAGSALLALCFPALGLDASTGHGGDWQGVFTQKNACGRGMVFAIAGVLASPRIRVYEALLLALFGGELILSGSRGGWLIGALSIVFLVVLRVSSRFDRTARVALFCSVGFVMATGATLAATRFADVAQVLGRDATLTGRTAIWLEVWVSILGRPWLGYGFSAFWRGMEGASWNVVVALHFVLFHAHNGFLEIWVNLGLLGLALFCASYLRGLLLLSARVLQGEGSAVLWPAGVLLLVLLYDLDENTLLSFNGLFSVLYAGALAAIEVHCSGRRDLYGSAESGISPAAPQGAGRFTSCWSGATSLCSAHEVGILSLRSVWWDRRRS